MNVPRVVYALGTMMRLFSLTSVVPLVASLFYDESIARVTIVVPGLHVPVSTVFFAGFLVGVFLIGTLARVLGDARMEELRESEGFVIVGLSYLLLGILASVPFLVLGATRDPVDALFEAMSGLTTTGATVLELPLEAYTSSVMLWRAMLQYFGGIGIVVLSVAVIGRLTQGGSRMMALETPGGTVTRLKPKITQTAKALSIIYLGFSGACFVLYLFAMRASPMVDTWKEAAFDALLHTFTTVSTAGFSNRTESLGYYQSPAVLWIAIVFMVLCAGSFTLYWLALHGRPNRLWKDGELHFYLLLLASACILVVGVLVFAGGRGPLEAINDGVFQTVSLLTTTGYTSTDHDAFPDSARLVFFLLMFTGGMAGSTAGGIKIFRIQILFKLTKREVQKLLHPHAVATVKSRGRIVPDDFLRRVVVFFFSYITLFIIGAFVYIYLGLDLVSGLSTSAAAVGNIGPGLGSVAGGFHDVPDAGKLFAVLQMWFGRLEIFTAFLLFVPGTYRD